MSNLGHRCGSVIKTAPENTIRRLKDNWKYQDNVDFKYFEFDIVETADSEIVCHHDRHVIDANGTKINIKDVNYNYLVKYFPYIPTLQSLFKAFEELNETATPLLKPIRIEVKRFHSDYSRAKLAILINEFRHKISFYDVHCISFDQWFPKCIKHFKKSYPSERKTWGNYYKQNKLNFFKVGKHSKELFKNPHFTNTEIETYIKGLMI